MPILRKSSARERTCRDATARESSRRCSSSVASMPSSEFDAPPPPAVKLRCPQPDAKGARVRTPGVAALAEPLLTVITPAASSDAASRNVSAAPLSPTSNRGKDFSPTSVAVEGADAEASCHPWRAQRARQARRRAVVEMRLLSLPSAGNAAAIAAQRDAPARSRCSVDSTPAMKVGVEMVEGRESAPTERRSRKLEPTRPPVLLRERASRVRHAATWQRAAPATGVGSVTTSHMA